MLPSESVLRAAKRWVLLLRTSTETQSWALLRSSPEYRDLTTTQYADGFDWLKLTGLVVRTQHGWALAAHLVALPRDDVIQTLLRASLAQHRPLWLRDADLLVGSTADFPEDLHLLLEALNSSEAQALTVVRQLQGHVNLAERARVGLAGELALLTYLNSRYPGSTQHVAAESDGYGYDLSTALESNWHLEVKSTTVRSRLDLYLSRHEYEVGLVDPAWHLIVVGLNVDALGAIATVKREVLIKSAPLDGSAATWQSARYRLSADDLVPGLPFDSIEDLPVEEPDTDTRPWSWFPHHKL